MHRIKAAILSDDADSFPKPLGRGLRRMTEQAGSPASLFEHGLASLPQHEPLRALRRAFAARNPRALLRVMEREWAWHRLQRQLRGHDVAIVVGHLPRAYLHGFLSDRRFRQALPRLPLVLYDLIYLGTDHWWTRRLAGLVPDASLPPLSHLGLDRYDHHLCVTELNGEELIPKTADFTRIGVDLDEPSLRVEPQMEFSVLIDFERPNYLRERAIQINACLEAGIPFRVLHGNYRMEEIRAEYRRTAAYFLAHHESFGLPISEVQACGSRVLTPYADWCRPHHLPAERNQLGPLPDNIIVYGNDPKRLVATLRELRRTHDPIRNRESFIAQQPTFFRGDVAALRRFLERVATGKINPNSHANYPAIRQMAAGLTAGSPVP